MKVAVCVFALLFSHSVFADKPLYAGISLGSSFLDDRINVPEWDEESAISGQIYLGYQFQRWVALEVSYGLFDDLESESYDLLPSANVLAKSVLSGSNVGVGVILSPGIMKISTTDSASALEVKPLAMVGWHHWDIEEEIRVSSGISVDEDHDGDDLWFGLGLDIKAGDSFYFRLEWRQLQFHDIDDANMDVVWFGMREEFGIGR